MPLAEEAEEEFGIRERGVGDDTTTSKDNSQTNINLAKHEKRKRKSSKTLRIAEDARDDGAEEETAEALWGMGVGGEDDGDYDLSETEDDSRVLEVKLLVIKECFVYRIPREQLGRQYYAQQWGLDKPMAICELHISSKGETLFVRLVRREQAPPKQARGGDGVRGGGGGGGVGGGVSLGNNKKRFVVLAQSRIEFARDPTHAASRVSPYFVQRAQDTSRYYGLRCQGKDNRGKERNQVIGIGFRQRPDSFNFTAALQDHHKFVLREWEAAEERKAKKKRDEGIGTESAPGIPSDIAGGQSAAEERATEKSITTNHSLQDGQKIKLNFAIPKKSKRRSREGRPLSGSMATAVLSPPPSSSSSSASTLTSTSSAARNGQFSPAQGKGGKKVSKGDGEDEHGNADTRNNTGNGRGDGDGDDGDGDDDGGGGSDHDDDDWGDFQ